MTLKVAEDILFKKKFYRFYFGIFFNNAYSC